MLLAASTPNERLIYFAHPFNFSAGLPVRFTIGIFHGYEFFRLRGVGITQDALLSSCGGLVPATKFEPKAVSYV